MPLTRSFKETIGLRVQNDPEFRRMLLIDALNEFLAGDIELGKSILRDYINATITFQPLALQLHKNSKSIQRMFSTHGNPTTKSFFEIISILQKQEGVALKVIAQ